MTALMETQVTPRVDFVVITPSMAARYLEESNTGNRRLSPSTVARYAADMASGAWRQGTSAPIIFDWNGRLQDGQHRLAAIVSSGQSINTMMVWDADPEDFRVLDQGKKRQASDVLGMSGFGDTRSTAAAARFAVLLERCPDKPWQHLPEMTQQVVVAFAEQNREIVTRAVSQGRMARHNALLPASQYAAVACHVAMHSPSTALWDTFHESICSGLMLKERDPEFVLRRWAMNRRAVNGSGWSQQAVAIITKAWNAYVREEPISLLRWRKDELPMPQPLASA